MIRGGSMTVVWLLLTVGLTVYGQLVFKWRIDDAGEVPGDGSGRLEYALRLALDPWVISTIVAVGLASVTYAAALTRTQLSIAYPFMSLSFVLVLLLSAPLFHEPLTAAKVIGVGLIVVGVIVGAR